MRKILKIVGLALIFSTLFSTNNRVLASDTTSVIQLCFPDNASPLNNVILANLAPSLPVEGGKSCLKYSIDFIPEISVGTVKMYYRNAKVINPVVFQRFSLRDLLLPMSIVVDVEFMDKSTLVEKREVKFTLEQSGLFYTFNVPVGKKVTDAKVTIRKTELGQEMLDRIVTRQQDIADYYTSDVQIKLMEEELKKVDFDNIENIEQFQEITRKVLNVANRIRAKNLDEKLFLNENDPLKIQSRLQSLYQLAHGHKAKLTKQTANINEEYYRLGVVELSKKNVDSAVVYFNRAIEIEPRYSMPYVKLASIDLAKYNVGKAIERILFIDNETDHDSLARREASALLSEIVADMTADARLLRQQANFTDALTQIDSCYALCNQISFLKCDSRVDVERNEIYTALFMRRLKENRAILEQKKYTEFISNCDTLSTYQTKNKDYLNNRALFFDHLNDSYNSMVKHGEEIINANPAGALDALMASKQICTKYTEVACNPKVEDLINSVFGKLYESMVDEAVLLFNAQKVNQADSLQQKARGYCVQQKLTLVDKHIALIKEIKKYRYGAIMEGLEKGIFNGCVALNMADSAVQMRKQYDLETVQNESELVRKAASSCINGTLVEAEKYLISKQFPNVVNSINYAEHLAATYKIELEYATATRIAEIKGLLEQGICGEIKFKIDIQLNAADIHQRALEYRYAIIALNKAKLIVKENPNCGFTSDDIITRIAYLQTAANYEKEYDDIIFHIQKHNFSKAIAQTIILETQYPDSLLSVYKLKYRSIVNFIKEYNYVPFTLGAIEYLADQGETEIALELMYFLYELETLSHLTDSAQIKLGRSLAKRDVALQKEDDSKMVVYQYVRHDEKYFKKLINAYKSQWAKSIAS